MEYILNILTSRLDLMYNIYIHTHARTNKPCRPLLITVRMRCLSGPNQQLSQKGFTSRLLSHFFEYREREIKKESTRTVPDP